MSSVIEWGEGEWTHELMGVKSKQDVWRGVYLCSPVLWFYFMIYSSWTIGLWNRSLGS